MTPWLAMIPVTLILFAGSFLSYHRAERGWFPFAFVGLSVVYSVCWAWACVATESKRQLYSIGVAMDVATLAAYSLMPLLLSGVRLSATAGCGVMLVLFGACLVKWG